MRRRIAINNLRNQFTRYQTVGHAEHVMAGGQYQIVKVSFRSMIGRVSGVFGPNPLQI